MREYDQAEIDELIAMPKKVSEPPKKTFDEERGHLKNDMVLQSLDESKKFKVFIRKNKKFPENFSVGLIYEPQDGTPSVPLIRCNGPHGEYNRELSGHQHFQFHIHRADAELVNAGADPMSSATMTSEYASLEEAILHFCKSVALVDFEGVFPSILQMNLFRKP